MLLLAGMPMLGTLSASAEPAPQQQSQAATTIQGTVMDENNEPVIGASVVQKGVASNAVATDAFGNFKIRIPAGAQLEFSYVGYKTVSVKAADGMTVYLEPTTEMLNELVAVGYGSQKRANLTGAVATVDVARTMDNRTTGDVTKALQGAVPGLTITTNSGDINASGTMKIRGTGTLSNSQTSDPLIVVDGVPAADISFLDPNDIKEISVLKDAASASIYGTRAANGVILITTKQANTKDRVSLKYTNNFAWSHATTLPKYGTVMSQIDALQQTNRRQGLENELFGMNLDKMRPYAEAWYQQHGGKPISDVRELIQAQYLADGSVDMSNVGDFAIVNGVGQYYADFDVAGIMFNNAVPSQKHNVSLEGVSGKTNYRASFGYDERQGIMNFNPDKMRRYNANLFVQTEIFSWLKAGARFNFSNKEYEGQNQYNDTYTYLWRWGSYFGPYGYFRGADGNVILPRSGYGLQAWEQGQNKDVATNTRMQAWLDATIIPGLTLHGDFTYDLTNRVNDYNGLPTVLGNTWGGNPLTGTSTVRAASNSYASQDNFKDDVWTMNVYGTYAKTFGQDHNLKVMVGGTAERERYNGMYAQRYILQDINLPNIGLTTGGDEGTRITISNTQTHRATAGFFGRINYDYKGIYLFEANGRYDGSSHFPAADQWAFFPSVSAGYRFSEENYFKPLKNWWSNGKLRASYGQIGNEAVGDNMFISTISNIATSSMYWISPSGTKVSGANMPSLVSSTLKWERVETVDVGLDLGFLDNSLNVTFDWFQRDTKDMLAPGNAVAATLGASAPYLNEGQLRTRGWELGVSWNHSFGDADVFASANIYDGKTTVLKYPNDTKSLSSFYTGKEYGAIWGFETDRYFTVDDFTWDTADGKYAPGAKQTGYASGIADQTVLQTGNFVYGPGDIKYKDLDGNGEIDGGKGTADDHGDLKIIGNALPRYEYSFRLGAAWKGFDIDLFFQGVGKRNMWYTSAFVMPLARGADATYANQESYNKILWDEAGKNIIGYEVDQNNDYPALYSGFAGGGNVSGISAGTTNYYPQSKYLMNMAYLRFKTLTVGYTLPVEITKKALIQKARIYFTAENLCNLYNGMRKYYIDPEIGSTWKTTSAYSNGTFGRTAPMMASYSFGIQVTF